MTPLGAVGRGLVAGLVGTACMTAWQELSSKLKQARQEQEQQGGGDGGESSPSWESAPAPAVIAKRVVEGVFQREVPAEKIPLLTNVMHWGYGTAWGPLFGLVQGTFRPNPVAHGLAFGSGVWAMSYVELVPMGLYEPPWTYPPKSLAKDLSYHLVYGLGLAAGWKLVERAARE